MHASQSSHSPRFLFASVSRIGDRTEQQDAFAAWTKGGDWFGVVTDGAGGHILGGAAAKTAIHTAKSSWEAGTPCEREKTEPWLLSFLKNANTAILNATGGKGRATIAALYIKESLFLSAHLGDTRIYQIREGEIIFRTRDDSLAQLLCDHGEISESEIATHPGQSRLFKALGDPREIEPGLHTGICRPGDIFLICTDGFWTHFDNKELTSTLSRFSQAPFLANPDTAELQKTLDNLAASAVERGCGMSDNVSATIVVCSAVV